MEEARRKELARRIKTTHAAVTRAEAQVDTAQQKVKQAKTENLKAVAVDAVERMIAHSAESLGFFPAILLWRRELSGEVRKYTHDVPDANKELVKLINEGFDTRELDWRIAWNIGTEGQDICRHTDLIREDGYL